MKRGRTNTLRTFDRAPPAIARGESRANNSPEQVSGLAALSPAAFPAKASGIVAGLRPHTVTGSRRLDTDFPLAAICANRVSAILRGAHDETQDGVPIEPAPAGVKSGFAVPGSTIPR
jgi:hypothetical protein